MSRAQPVEGRDYHCGTCAGHGIVPCDECFVGCDACRDTGEMKCPQCRGGEIPVPPPAGAWAILGTGGDSTRQG